MTITINRTAGDFGVNFTKLAGDFTDNIATPLAPAPTPEPATMLLLGAALTGLAAAGRKKKA